MLTKPRTVCACQPVASMISASVAPLARFIMARTSAFLLLRSSAPFCARARRGALAGDFFAFSFAGATSGGSNQFTRLSASNPPPEVKKQNDNGSHSTDQRDRVEGRNRPHLA